MNIVREFTMNNIRMSKYYEEAKYNYWASLFLLLSFGVGVHESLRQIEPFVSAPLWVTVISDFP